ncbi:MAG: hypothetical protein GX442_12835 [Candidatus Riflebacteria bacterium]|nr:hypothetical protein [Candidatus Riflebacteria bacterium]
MTAWTCPVPAQEGGPAPLPQAPFPDWMDKATVGPARPSAAGPGGLTEPVEPTDPDPAGGGMKPVQGPNSQSRFRFTPPKMPDLSQMRQKATRMSLQRTASGTETTELETFDCTNLDGERREIARLEAALLALPAGPLREAVTARLAEQKRRVAAAEELATLLPPAANAPRAAAPGQTGGGTSTAATPATENGPAGPVGPPATPGQAAGSPPGPALLTATPPAALSPAQRRRVDDLRRLLWTPPQAPLPPLPPPTPAAPAPAGEVRIPAQFYRPEGRKSFFQERREEIAAEEQEEAAGQEPRESDEPAPGPNGQTDDDQAPTPAGSTDTPPPAPSPASAPSPAPVPSPAPASSPAPAPSPSAADTNATAGQTPGGTAAPPTSPSPIPGPGAGE